MATRKSIRSLHHTIYFGEDVFEKLNTFLHKGGYSSFHILVDENSHRHCLPILNMHCEALAEASVLEIESGEKNKNIEVCAQLWSALTEEKAGRKALVINLGGGVICDMGGFMASTYKRGIGFINIPTTLLAQVDASIGGKTGIDLEGYKNQVGLFAFPQAVFVHTGFPETQDHRQYLSGFAEMIKHGLISDSLYWKTISSINTSQANFAAALVPRSIEIKNEIVLADPNEKNLRRILNFGHTIGHALESYFLESADPLLHGEAVAIGMICETYLSAVYNDLGKRDLERISSFILEHFAKRTIPQEAFSQLLDNVLQDKKNNASRPNFSLLEQPGAATFDNDCSFEQVIASLEYYNSL